MIVTKHVSLDDDCIKNMQPYEDRHNGNFSAAIREIIERAGKSVLPNSSTIIDNSLFKMMLAEIDEILVSDNVLDELIDPKIKIDPGIPLSLTSLGRRIGKSLMQVYENKNENNIKNWEGKSIVYKITKCNIASNGDKFDMYLCHNGREAFKGALSYAFGNNAELEIKKIMSHKNKFCEVVIKIP